VSLGILAKGYTDGGTDRKVDGRSLLDGPLGDWQSLDQNETGTINRGVPDLGEELEDDGREGKGLLSLSAKLLSSETPSYITHPVDFRKRKPKGRKLLIGGVKRGKLLSTPEVLPERFVVDKVLPGPDGAAGDLRGELLVGREVSDLGVLLSRGQDVGDGLERDRGEGGSRGDGDRHVGLRFESEEWVRE
jgi:hypothetical protein